MWTPRNTPGSASRGRRSAQRALAPAVAAMAAAAVALTAACSDAPSAPSARPAPVLLAKSSGGPGSTDKVDRESALLAPVSVSYQIDPKRNGSFSIPGTGLEIEVPKGAVREAVTITATAVPGTAIAYEFEPHGLVFQRPLHARQDLKGASPQILSQLAGLRASLLLGGGGTSPLEISYFADVSALEAGPTVRVQEFLGSQVDLDGSRIEFDIQHFSGYMVSWGRRNNDD